MDVASCGVAALAVCRMIYTRGTSTGFVSVSLLRSVCLLERSGLMGTVFLQVTIEDRVAVTDVVYLNFSVPPESLRSSSSSPCTVPKIWRLGGNHFVVSRDSLDSLVVFTRQANHDLL